MARQNPLSLDSIKKPKQLELFKESQRERVKAAILKMSANYKEFSENKFRKLNAIKRRMIYGKTNG